MMWIIARNSLTCMSSQKNCKAFGVETNFKTSLLNWTLVTLIFYDILLVSETRRDKREDAIVTAAGHKVFLSGGSCCRNGVGICVSRRLLDQISGLTFFAISDRILQRAITISEHFHDTQRCS